ncbi:transglutaminase-like cysteine peptidase [Motilimonas sp. KMU-193]|uniref:transglutaminase-like cysteine peptidase n=1 Tax=Motilimonas sp. KMU-193 TaxID=3388668 RepID=UPI00396B20E0
MLKSILFALSLVALAIPAINIQQYLTPAILEQVKEEHGNRAHHRVRSWQQLIEGNQHLGEYDKLKLVNDFFNQQIEFVDDISHWRQEDYWATPLETLITAGGDCEDFSIAKYFTLRALGVDEDKLRMMYVKALDYNQAHMVVIYLPEPGAYPLVLDNINRDILSAQQRRDLRPVYSFNGQGLWMAKAQGLGNKVKQRRGFAPWVKLIKRIEQGQ